MSKCSPMFSPTLSFCRLSNKHLTQPAARAEPGMAPPHCRDCTRAERQGEPVGDASGVLHGASQRKSDTACPRINRDAWTKCASAALAPHPPSRHTRRERARCNPKSHPSDPSRSRAGRPAEHWACTQECSARQLVAPAVVRVATVLPLQRSGPAEDDSSIGMYVYSIICSPIRRKAGP